MDHPLAAPQAALDRQEVDNGATPDLLNDEDILNEATEDFRYLCKQLEEERDEMHGKVIELTSLLEEKDIELQTAFEEAAEMLQNERDGFANSEEGYELQIEELANQLEETKEKLANMDALQTNAFEEGMNAANRTQSDIQVELEALSLQLDEAKEEILQLKSGRAYYELESKVEDLTADLTKERTNSQAQMALFTDQIEEARNEGHNRVEEVKAECAKAHEEIVDQLMKDFASEKEEIEAHGKVVFEEEITKLLSSMEHKESLLDASLSREESLRAQIDELTNNLAATHADFEEMKTNFQNVKDTFETEKEAMITSHQSAISDAQRHFAEERDKLETSMHDMEITATQKDDKVTVIETELVSMKEEKDKLSDELVQVQNEKVELQDSNKAMMEEIKILKTSLDKKNEENQKLQSVSPSHKRYSPVSTTRGLPRNISSSKPVTSTSRSNKSPGSAKVDGASTLRKFSTPSVAKVATSSTYQNKTKPKVSSTNSTPKRTPLSAKAKNNQLLRTTTFTSRNISIESTGVRVLFCMKHTDVHKKIVTALGGSIVDIDDASLATHVIAGDDKTPIRRTPRLLIGICVTANILSMEWLVSSKRSRRFLETRPFLLLHDRIAERNYSFSMKETLLNGQLRRQEGGVLKDLNVYFCKKLAGNKAPKADELNLIVSCAGGNVISELSVENVKLKKILVITSDPTTQPDLVEEQKAEPFLSEISDVFPTSWFYDVILHQKLSGLKRGKK